MALLKSNKVQNGPIPGENYTSNTKNYPWHRPPKYTNLDDAIEDAYKTLMEKPAGLLTMMKVKIPIAALTELFLLNGMSKGKWTPDFMILMAGPVAHIMYLMAKEAKINPEMGLDDKRPAIGPGWVDMMSEFETKQKTPKKLDVDIEKVKAAAGFMDIESEISESEESEDTEIEDLEMDEESDLETEGLPEEEVL